MGARPWGICSPTDRIFPGCVWQGVCGASLLTLRGLCRLSPLSFSALPPPPPAQDISGQVPPSLTEGDPVSGVPASLRYHRKIRGGQEDSLGR